MKKAQLAVETLMIYGVVIMIVILAIGALWSLDIINFDSLFPDSCKIDTGFVCENFLVSQDEVQLELRNRFGVNVESVKVTIDGEDQYSGLWNCLTGDHDLIIQGDLSEVISITCDIKVPVGKKIQGKISADVNLVGSNIVRTVQGTIRATVS